MLRRQRAFFLTSNQYEPVLLEFAGVASSRLWYKFKVFDDATRYYARYRQSVDGGLTWTAWEQTQEITINREPDGYVYLYYPASDGLMYETSVVMTGDDKDPSDESNIVTTIYPYEPVQSPPILSGYPFYYNGKPCPYLKPDRMPDGVSSFIVWQREFGETDWTTLAVVPAQTFLVTKETTPDWTEPGNKYQYIIAWYDNVNHRILSDISNVVTVDLPPANISTLLPPINIDAFFVDLSGQGYNPDYYNELVIGRGDMRNEGYRFQYRRSTENVWTSLGDFPVDSAYINDKIHYLMVGHASPPITGEIWEYRLKNYATGLADSDFSGIFSITIPAFLPKVGTPTIVLSQSNMYVVMSISAVEDAVGFKIERRSSSDSNWTVLETSLAPSTRSYIDYGTQYGNTYFYRVTALGDNITYQDSNPAQQSITVVETIVLQPPVIDSLTESGVDMIIAISGIDTVNTSRVEIEMSENNGAWVWVAAGLPETMSQTSFTKTIDGTKINEGGNLRFRAKAYPYPNTPVDPSDYSTIASITIDLREWLLKWNGTSWDYCTSVTGGWYSPAITDSEHTTSSGAIVPQDLGNGVLRLCGANNTLVEGWYMNRTGFTNPNTPLTSKYRKICVIGNLVKSQAGTSNHAWLGTAYTYTFSGGIAVDTSRGTRTIAGSDSGQGYAGTVTNPEVSACGTSNRATAIDSHVYFYFKGGYADIKGIYAIKR